MTKTCQVKVNDKGDTCKGPSVGTVTRHDGTHQVCDKHWDNSKVRF